MGLDLVELVMDVEDEFQIRIPDELADELRTAGQLADAIAAILRANATTPAVLEQDLDRRVWERVVALCSKACDNRGLAIARETRFTEDMGLG